MSKWAKLADSVEALSKRFDGIATRLDGEREDKDRAAFGYMEGWESARRGQREAHNPYPMTHPAHPEWNKGNVAYHTTQKKS